MDKQHVNVIHMEGTIKGPCCRCCGFPAWILTTDQQGSVLQLLVGTLLTAQEDPPGSLHLYSRANLSGVRGYEECDRGFLSQLKKKSLKPILPKCEILWKYDHYMRNNGINANLALLHKIET